MNPANGSVSIRIPVRIPEGRELTIPFYIAYDSNGSFYYGQSPGNQQPHYATTTNVPFTLGGWSYTFPMLTYQLVTWTQQYPNGGRNYTCTGSMGYVFQDPTGNRHNLPMTVAPTSGPGGADCGGNNATQGSEGPILGASGLPSWGWGTYPTATVTDGNGTLYSFPGGLETIPTSITDRNGNEISISSTSSSASVTDTVGRTAVSVPTFGSSPDNISVAGLSSPYAVSWTTASANFTISTVNLNPSIYQNCPTSMSASAKVVSQIVLPNAQKYAFSYDPTYGMLTKITYPSGGYVSYQWGLNSQAEAGGWVATNGTSEWYCTYDFPAVTDRWVNDGVQNILHQHFSYTTNWNGSTGQWTTKTTKVVTYDLIRNTSFETDYTYTPVPSPAVPNPTGGAEGCGITCAIPVESEIAYNDTGGGTLKIVAKTWCNGDPRELCSDQTTLGTSGPVAKTTYTYNSSEQETERDEYDYGPSSPGSLLRKTTTSYASFTGAHIVDLPSSVITYADGSSSPAAETDSYYDQTTPASPPTAPVQHVSAPGGTARGNLTTVVKQCFGCAANPTTTYAYYNTGQVTQMTDPNGNPTGFSYTDNYSPCGGNAPPSGSSMAYLTQVTYPPTSGVAHVEGYCYDYAAGLLRSSTDQNSQVTSYRYNDSFDRLTEADYPDGGQTLISYNDAPPSPTLTVQKKLNTSGQYATNITVTNGLGLPTETELTSDPQGTDYTSTTYDGLGRAYQVTNPYRSTSDPTYGVTTYNYDSLGRVTQVTHPDSSTVLSEHVGRATEVQDEGNGTSRVTRISQADALGRLISVCEVSGATQMGTSGTPGSCGQDIPATGFLTTYSYDALDNLASVNQPGLGTRTFSYNSLFELTSVTNPENGTISYSYDANGNVMTKTAPAPNQTGSATVTTSYQYDALNRVTQKSYSDGTPTVQFGYDTATMTIGSLQVQATNPVGRLSWEATSPYPASFTQSSFSYDPMGRINEHWSCQNVSCSHSILWLSYTYDSLGDELTRTLNGNTHAATYDTAGRLTSYTQTNYTNPTNPANLLTGVTYDPFGHMTFANFGNGLSQSWAYDNRGRVTALAAGTGCTAGMGTCTNTKYSYTVGYAPDGDILSANDSINGNWAYAYDAFNRLAAASCSVSAPMTCPDGSATEGFTYAYDQYGNMWHGDGSLSVSYSGGNNRIDGYNYDTAGDLLNDGNHSYSYDAENRIATVDGGATSYFYDAEGRRLEKTENGTPLFDYFYDRTGHVSLVVETIGGSPYPFYGEEYAGGLHLASHVLNAAHNGTDTYFHHNDWLGTERARTDMTGNLCETVSSLPFGDSQNISTTCAEGDVSPMHFTGKERDAESGLDNFGARYNSSQLGRFMSPDQRRLSIRDLINPQKWNKYAYTINNPLRYFDPDGMEEIEIQLRAFIAQKSVTVMGSTYAGDNRTFSTAANASSRTSITVRIETDPSVRANPIISVNSVAGQSAKLDANGNVISTATATAGLPTVNGTRDANGNVVLNFQQDTKNPLSPGPQALTPGISTDLSVTVPQNGSSITAAGTTSGFPSMELNVTPDGQPTTNLPLNDPGPNGSAWSLFGTNNVLVSKPLPPPPPPCAQDRDKPCQ